LREAIALESDSSDISHISTDIDAMNLPINEPETGDIENYDDSRDLPDIDPDPDGLDLSAGVGYGDRHWDEEDSTDSDDNVKSPFQDLETNENNVSDAEQDLEPDEVTDSDLYIYL
jgi:hypothetical protein